MQCWDKFPKNTVSFLTAPRNHLSTLMPPMPTFRGVTLGAHLFELCQASQQFGIKRFSAAAAAKHNEKPSFGRKPCSVCCLSVGGECFGFSTEVTRPTIVKHVLPHSNKKSKFCFWFGRKSWFFLHLEGVTFGSPPKPKMVSNFRKRPLTPALFVGKNIADF